MQKMMSEKKKEILNLELTHPDFIKSAVLILKEKNGLNFELNRYAKFLYSKGFDVFCPECDENFYSYKDWINFAMEKYRCLRGYYTNFYILGFYSGIYPCLYLSAMLKAVSGIICFFPYINFNYSKNKLLDIIAKNSILKHYSYLKISENKYYPINYLNEISKLKNLLYKNIVNITSPCLFFAGRQTNDIDFIYKKISSKTKEKIILNENNLFLSSTKEKNYIENKTLEFLFNLENKKSYGAIFGFNKEVVLK